MTKTIIINGNKFEVTDGGVLVPVDASKKTKEVKECGNAGYDDVARPSHYAEGRKYEPRKVIFDWDLDFNLGSALKYIARAGRKGSAAMSQKEKTIQDLKKAIQYIEFEIDELTSLDK